MIRARQTTGDDGSFRFPALVTGHYSVRVEREGFKTETQTGLTLEVTQELVVNTALEVGTATQEVTVTGEAPVVNTTNASLGGLVNESKMADLPLNGRNYTDLTFMQPGVSITTNASSSSATGRDTRHSVQQRRGPGPVEPVSRSTGLI